MTATSSSRRAALKPLTLTPAPGVQQQASEILLSANKDIHAGLWLDKYITDLKRYKAGGQDDTGRSPQQRLVNEVASLAVPDIYEHFYKRWESDLQAAGAITFPSRVRGRMVVGLGNESVLETSVTLHHTYGVPYIPGSALKGLAASYARLVAGLAWQPGGVAYTTAFGTTDSAGYLTFYDALYIPNSAPDKGHPLRADVLTVHHPDYYQKKNGKREAPADWDSPNPVPFLTATGSYLIALAAPDLKNRDAWIASLFTILEEALLMLGIGAKTSSGYGRMEIVRSATKTSSPEMRAAENLVGEISRVKNIPGEMHGYYQKWKQMEAANARRVVARAIIGRIAEAHAEKWASQRTWYQELQTFLAQAES
ncbi:MAG TPA: type III-B CRISPR module RAMP protein Cmr6 [Ktedonobacteraceae bacterium]|nr:type III-B CRISPR module RAMP protein Cmr6 [Ktedonobacteraceae bacterium]